MDDLPSLLTELAKVGPFVVLLGWLTYKFMGKSETSDKALIDYLANKNESNINALNKSSDAAESAAKAVETLAKEVTLLRGDISIISSKIGDRK